MTRASIAGVALLVAWSSASASSLDKEVIRRPIRTKLPQIRACYEKALKEQPGLQGKVVVRFVIGRNGAVIEAEGTGLGAVSSCVASVIRTIVFPSSERGTITVSYPFLFRPEQ